MPEDEPERPRRRCRDIFEPPEYDEAGSFAHDEPVAVLVKRTRGEFGRAHVPAHRVESHEAAHGPVADERVNAACENDVCRAPAQQLNALAYSCRARRAGR